MRRSGNAHPRVTCKHARRLGTPYRVCTLRIKPKVPPRPHSVPSPRTSRQSSRARTNRPPARPSSKDAAVPPWLSHTLAQNDSNTTRAHVLPAGAAQIGSSQRKSEALRCRRHKDLRP
eukprot:439718-Pleurochrysis_carterae.AAC.1